MSPSAENFRKRESFRVSLISSIEKVLIRGERGYQEFPSKTFCLTLPKNFVREHFTVSLILGIEKKFYVSEAYVTIFDFSVEVFLSHRAENSVGEPFCAVFQKISGSETVYG